jgi:alpha-tubulin suppressor-like RCC1 family protein
MKTAAVRSLLVAVLAVGLTGPVTAATASARVPARATRQAAAPVPGQGPLLAWGLNESGQLGTGDTTSYLSPIVVNRPFGLRASSARIGGFSVAVNSSGLVYAWGEGEQGELGNGGFTSHLRPVRVRLPKGVKIRTARVGFQFAVALTTTGKVLTWGRGDLGQLGNGHRVTRNAPVFVRLPRGVRATAVSAFTDGAIALTSTGRVLAWGYNFSGQLGNGKKAGTDVPVYVKLPKGTKVTSIAAGSEQLFAITSAGGMLAWGSDSNGQLGNGHTGGLSRVPVRVHLPRGVKVVSASAGLLHGLAQTTTGKVLAWGNNLQGQLGDGTRKQRNVPVFVHLPKIARIVSIAAGRYHSLALTRSGFLLGWGDDAFGQMGDGGFADKLAPTRIFVPANRVIAIGAGPEAYDSMAIVDELVA